MKESSSSKPDPLPDIGSPEDLKQLPAQDLAPLADKIRRELIEKLSRTGGHLGPNLGVVELTIALHRVFDSPSDKFLFDVSHQGYVHKMLTGRWNRINSIRQYEGLNGFLLRTESEHDCYGAGHAGTALSAALGMAAARDLKQEKNHVMTIKAAKKKVVKLDIPDDDEDSECADNQAQPEDEKDAKDGKKAHVHEDELGTSLIFEGTATFKQRIEVLTEDAFDVAFEYEFQVPTND